MALATSLPVAAGPAAAGSRTLRSVSRIGLDGLVVVAVLLFGFLAVGPRLLPYRTVTMLTGSMAPTIPAGAVAVDVAEPMSALRPGQVISFHAPTAGHPVVTHRVVDVVHRGGTTMVRTRGDANNGADAWLAVVHGRQVWRVRAVVPHLGEAIRLLRRPAVHLAVAWVLPAALLAWFLAALWRPASPLASEALAAEGGERACAGTPLQPSRSASSARVARSPGRSRRRRRRPHSRSRRRRSNHRHR